MTWEKSWFFFLFIIIFIFFYCPPRKKTFLERGRSLLPAASLGGSREKDAPWDDNKNTWCWHKNLRPLFIRVVARSYTKLYYYFTEWHTIRVVTLTRSRARWPEAGVTGRTRSPEPQLRFFFLPDCRQSAGSTATFGQSGASAAPSHAPLPPRLLNIAFAMPWRRRGGFLNPIL